MRPRQDVLGAAWGFGQYLDPGRVLDADVAVPAGADQSNRRTVVAVERAPVAVLHDEERLGQRRVT
jgi:hypothetical protein